MNAYYLISLLSWVQALILLLFYGNFIFWFLLKDKRQRDSDRKTSKCSALITKKLMKFLEGKNDFKIYNFRKSTRKVFKAKLLEHIAALSGTEKEFLVAWYRKWEFIEEDFEDLNSRKWWRRLRAMVNLDVLADEKIVSAVWPVIDDPNQLVAYSAMKTIARIGTKIQYKALLNKMDNLNIVQTDLVMEVLSDISKKNPELLVSELKEVKNKKIKNALIHVLGETNNIESIPVLINLLNGGNSNQNEVIIYCLRALAKIGDPATISEIKLFLKCKDSKVRAEAIAALSKLDQSFTTTLLKNFANDSSIEVVSILRRLKLISLDNAS